MEHDVLIKIAKHLNSNNITWALGASYVLYFYGIIEKPRDIDIIVSEDDIHKTVKLLSQFGKMEEEPPKGDYLTEYFYYYTINHTEVDVICNFKLKHELGIYAYHFDELAITKYVDINDEKIPLCSLEDWYLLYLVMHNKKGRADQIETYFKHKGIRHLDLIERAVKQPLPKEVLARVKKCIIQYG